MSWGKLSPHSWRVNLELSFSFLICEVGWFLHLYKVLVRWLSKRAEVDWAWLFLPALPYPSSFLHLLLLEYFAPLQGAIGLTVLPFSLNFPSPFYFWRPMSQMHRTQGFQLLGPFPTHCHLPFHTDKNTNANIKSTSELFLFPPGLGDGSAVKVHASQAWWAELGSPEPIQKCWV